jgi:hypothetical protein
MLRWWKVAGTVSGLCPVVGEVLVGGVELSGSTIGELVSRINVALITV